MSRYFGIQLQFEFDCWTIAACTSYIEDILLFQMYYVYWNAGMNLKFTSNDKWGAHMYMMVFYNISENANHRNRHYNWLITDLCS